MDKKEKLQQLLKRKERADVLPSQVKLKWKDEIIKLEKEIHRLKQELEKGQKTQGIQGITEEESILLSLLALDKTAIQYLYEKFIDDNSSIIEEFIEGMITAIYDYFHTKNKEELIKAKAFNDVLLETVYKNCKGKEVEEYKQMGFVEVKEPTPWG
ncbi:hypothetical protein [Clostridium formicaceticum]|uniref:Uncharacterized protein n=1 Tax=Clostridium formicaceticum TaxID=1497 RepID=A0AAC9RPV5_9CLOT|nr:hypothetical protein [Clostridium formicaceticum]AOY74709.1 hypothetical protein BJL90_01310 [Clostridium formicaceticum]ARE89088.1 hypothetical protein CLFO_34940 [Clostridium formicaceticum]